MPDLTLTRKELASLIRDGLLPAHCPGCAAPLNLRLGGDFAPLASGKPAGPGEAAGTGEKSDDVTRCVSCKKPISEYAFAVRKGLCTNCWGIMGGTAAPK
ncbi:MAG: hypothetical protein HY558_06810, partial [Euryarchaeota archaeon]|nr:hypothetical protein [Euryarchaeota archaeon]